MAVDDISSFPVSHYNNNNNIKNSKRVVNDEEACSANIEDKLLISRNSLQTTISSSNRSSGSAFYKYKDEKKNTKKLGLWYFGGTALILLGITTLVWTPFQIFMITRLHMLPGLPPYEWWKNPPDEVLMRVYVFNITNAEDFLNGIDAKLHLQEIGPIVFREKLTHRNVTFNDNGTLSYVSKRAAIFLPEMNNIDLNQTIFVPNLAILGMASYLWDASFFTKFAFNLLLRHLKSNSIVPRTIEEYLWNYTDPILDVAQTIIPALVPVKNMGILSRIYSDFENLVTVYIGSNGHEQFFKIDQFDGSQYLPGYGDTCEDTVVNSTEGVTYQQFLTKNSTLLYWRQTVCKVTPLYYNNTVRKYGMEAYNFILPKTAYDRTSPSYLDCYVSDPPLPSGLSDVSKCFYDFPMAASFPHFLHGDDVLKTYVDGLQPNEEYHESFVIVEPITGMPMESRARSQSNLVMRTLSGFNEIVDKFTDVIVPIFWAEYNQVGLPWYIISLVYFTVMILPYAQIVMSCTFIGTGLSIISVTIIKQSRNNREMTNPNLLRNKKSHFKRTCRNRK